MAFENINADSLINAINSCINSLDSNGAVDIKGNLSPNVLQANSGDTLKNSLGSLIDVKYKNLKDYLEQCLSIANSISNYKALQSENSNKQQRINELSKRINELHTYEKEYTNNFGLKRTKTFTETRINQNVVNEIENLKNQIKTNKLKMQKIETSVSGMF